MSTMNHNRLGRFFQRFRSRFAHQNSSRTLLPKFHKMEQEEQCMICGDKADEKAEVFLIKPCNTCLGNWCRLFSNKESIMILTALIISIRVTDYESRLKLYALTMLQYDQDARGYASKVLSCDGSSSGYGVSGRERAWSLSEVIPRVQNGRKGSYVLSECGVWCLYIPVYCLEAALGFSFFPRSSKWHIPVSDRVWNPKSFHMISRALPRYQILMQTRLG
jgi:hypothetical protein